jgi:hemolysin III
VLKLFFTGRYEKVSTLMYVFMGWIIVFAIGPLIDNLSPDGLSWLVAGGIAYTVGAILYGIKQIKFNHAIFHVFVLVGAFCHFVAVYFYVLPEI